MHELAQPISVLPVRALRGELAVPGDKSISHRSIMLGSLARGTTRISNFLRGGDNFSTMAAFRAMGVPIEDDGQTVTVHGVGLYGLKEPEDVLDCGNSGTTIRLMTGLLSGQAFFSVLTGDQYLRKRPMKRVVEPLAGMGARIAGRGDGTLAPLAISGGPLTGISYSSPIASAQVKSALMLAGLYATDETRVTEPTLSRDHSERMFRFFGADLETCHNGVVVRGGKELQGQEIIVPGDISSATFFIVAALMVRSSRLKGIEIGGDVVPRAIDEFPAISIAASVAEGTTVIRDARELRVKETDRIAAMATNLRAIGAGQIEETEDGMLIQGVASLEGGSITSCGDHRIAMALAVAALVSRNQVQIDDVSCVATSFPGFFELLDSVSVR